LSPTTKNVLGDGHLNGGLGGEEEADAGVLSLVLDQDPSDVDLPGLVDVRHRVVSGGIAKN